MDLLAVEAGMPTDRIINVYKQKPQAAFYVTFLASRPEAIRICFRFEIQL